MIGVKIKEMTLFCEGWTSNSYYKDCPNIERTFTLKNVYFKSIEDVLEFCKKVIENAKILE